MARCAGVLDCPPPARALLPFPSSVIVITVRIPASANKTPRDVHLKRLRLHTSRVVPLRRRHRSEKVETPLKVVCGKLFTAVLRKANGLHLALPLMVDD